MLVTLYTLSTPYICNSYKGVRCIMADNDIDKTIIVIKQLYIYTNSVDN